MKVSLILATKDRVEEVNRFIRSLVDQSYNDFELIIVDQNGDDRLQSTLAESQIHAWITHLRCEVGLSRARNLGLVAATGDIIAFPDDDCWYPPGLLARVISEFHRHPLVDGLTGRSEDGRGRASGGSFSRCQGRVDVSNVWKKGISYTIFLRSLVCATVGSFDEELGVGAQTPFGSGEETDYLVRAVKLGFDIQYRPDLVVFHPNPKLYNESHRRKAFRYGAGMGRVLSKHRYNLCFSLYTIMRPLGGAILSLLMLRPRKAAYHLAIAGGRASGLWSLRPMRSREKISKTAPGEETMQERLP
jgi:glycosyltransferase involved in cell wall biosynthesis